MRKKDLKRENEAIWLMIETLDVQLVAALDDRDAYKDLHEADQRILGILRREQEDLRQRWAHIVDLHTNMTTVIYPGSMAGQRAVQKPS